MTIKELGQDPPVAYAWLAMGSQGRSEQLLMTDQDNALVFENVEEAEYERVKRNFDNTVNLAKQGDISEISVKDKATELAAAEAKKDEAEAMVNKMTITAPFDAYLVLARCQLALSQLDKAVETLSILMEKSSDSQIWPWFLMAEGTRARINITKGQVPQMMEIIKQQRDLVATLKSPNELNWLIDMTEVFLRFTLDDWDRAEELLRRMPKIEMVRQIDLNVKFQSDPRKIPALVEAFPENTPREKVNKFLYQATINVESENIALGYLNKALEVGAEVGYHEYFVRQHRLYPIMVKAAAAQPTVFRESVVHEMTERIQAMNSDTGALEEKLTSRELEILKHLTTGVPLSAIAKQLHISQNTMKTHLRNVYRKLAVDGRHTAVEKAKKLLLI